MLLDDLATRLTNEGLVTAGFTLARGMLLDSPDQQLVLYENSGSGVETFLGNEADSPPIEQPAVQVVTRGLPHDYVTPRTQIERVFQAMLAWGAWETADGVRYLVARPLQSPFPFDRDGNQRVLFSVNFLLEKELSPV